MLLKKIEIRHFRNIHEMSLNPSRGINVFIGKNGQGKTSILEAISYLASLRSFRGAHSEDVIQKGNLDCKILGELTFDESFHTTNRMLVELGVNFSVVSGSTLENSEINNKVLKSAQINGKPIRQTSGYVSARFGDLKLAFHAIIFNPGDHDLVRGDPAGRRAYIDKVISAENSDYLSILKQYLRVLDQRNALLKDFYSKQPSKYSFQEFQSLLSYFTEPLVKFGASIIVERENWIQRANPKLSKIVNKIVPHTSTLAILYESTVAESYERSFSGQQPIASIQKIEESFRQKLLDKSTQEAFTKLTTVGPHRDDWGLVFDNQKLKNYGSQGEVRSALLALKLSEIELFIEARNQQPILLLDDFSSELDLERRQYLLSFLKNTKLQVFITTTEDIFGDFLSQELSTELFTDVKVNEFEKKLDNQKFNISAGCILNFNEGVSGSIGN